MIYLAADHRGFQLKEELKKFLISSGFEIEDVGAFAYNADDDYVDFARIASEKIVHCIKNSQGDLLRACRGVFMCGSGHGMDVVADKHEKILAARCGDVECAVQSREHGDANVLTLGADTIPLEAAKEIVAAWLKTPFSGEERHVRRLNKIQEIEEKNFR